MSTSFLRCAALLVLFACGWLWASPAQAVVGCGPASMTNVSFGQVNQQSTQIDTTATLTYTCTNTAASPSAINICFSISPPTGGSLRQMTDGSGHVLTYQLYTDASRTQPWGNGSGGTFPLQATPTIPASASANFTLTVYGRVTAGQTTAVPGSYSFIFHPGDTTSSLVEGGATTPAACVGAGAKSGPSFPFNVTASMVNSCLVSAGPTLDLGSVPATTTNLIGNNTITVTCSNGTPYTIGLLPLSTRGGYGGGLMSGSTPGNIDQVPYNLRSTSGMGGKLWGIAAATIVAGTGTGSGQSYTVYATTVSADVTPDTYSDTVTIQVNY